jgi:hypothetical protein
MSHLLFVHASSLIVHAIESEPPCINQERLLLVVHSSADHHNASGSIHPLSTDRELPDI